MTTGGKIAIIGGSTAVLFLVIYLVAKNKAATVPGAVTPVINSGVNIAGINTNASIPVTNSPSNGGGFNIGGAVTFG